MNNKFAGQTVEVCVNPGMLADHADFEVVASVPSVKRMIDGDERTNTLLLLKHVNDEGEIILGLASAHLQGIDNLEGGSLASVVSLDLMTSGTTSKGVPDSLRTIADKIEELFVPSAP